MSNSKANRPRIQKGTFKRLIKYVYSVNTYKLFIVLALMIIGTMTNIGATYTIQNVVKEAATMVQEVSRNFAPVIKQILIMASLYIVTIIFTYSHLRIMVDVGQNTLLKLRSDLFEHMTKLPIKYFDQNKHGELMSRYTNDVDATRQMISQSLPQLIIAFLSIFGFLTVMIITSYILASITIVITTILVVITQLISKQSRKYFINQQISLGKVNGYIEEMIEGQRVVKVFNHEGKAIEGFRELNEELFQNGSKASMRASMLIPITVNLGYLSYAAAAIAGSYLISIELLIIPQLVAYLLFTRQFTGPLNQISQQINFVNSALAGASRIFTVFDEKVEVDNGLVTLTNAVKAEGKLVATKDFTNIWAWKLPNSDDLVELKGDVRFHNVDFGYEEDKLVLKNVSLYAKPGQQIAFVGATGAGKTTITNLINRFYDIKSGTITYDGIDIKEIKKESLRQSLGMVLQDTNLFTNTVMENIRYGKLNASDEEVIEAAKLANAHDFIIKLPEGYQTILSDNASNLSQGQRQLISIARAAVSNHPVLILDEATSSVDTYTEKLIQTGMEQLMKGRTVFVIAHRLSTIKNSEAIMLLDYGEIIERGDHDTLVNARKRYYQLYTGVFDLD